MFDPRYRVTEADVQTFATAMAELFSHWQGSSASGVNQGSDGSGDVTYTIELDIAKSPPVTVKVTGSLISFRAVPSVVSEDPAHWKPGADQPGHDFDFAEATASLPNGWLPAWVNADVSQEMFQHVVVEIAPGAIS